VTVDGWVCFFFVELSIVACVRDLFVSLKACWILLLLGWIFVPIYLRARVSTSLSAARTVKMLFKRSQQGLGSLRGVLENKMLNTIGKYLENNKL